jgi:putative nucleotide binding protein
LSSISLPKKYEEYAYVLDFIPHGRSAIIKGREGPIVLAIGEERLTLLEILAMDNVTFDAGERIAIGKEGRSKIVSVLGRLSYEELNQEAKNELPSVTETIVQNNEAKYIAYFNELQAVTPRLHALELIPGIGKTFMMEIVKQRDRQPFTSFEDLQKRVGIREPARAVAKRILEEIAGGSRINLFVRR